VRDRVGEKPLFYSTYGNEIFFASELKSLACNIPCSRKVDKAGLQLYLLLRYVPAPHTILQGISKLKPGHYLKYKSGEFAEQTPYFSWDPHASEIPANSANYKEVVRGTEAMLVKSLETRLMSDVPLGFFLSGGVDSTLCAALIRKYFGKSINSYTIGFEGDSSSEHPFAEKTASIIGAQHNTQILKQDGLSEHSIEFLKKLDEPNGDRSCVPTYILCKHAKSEVTVALGGDGGDEMFSGYTRYPGLNKKINTSSFFNPVEMLKAYVSKGLPVFGLSVLSIFEKIEMETNDYLASLSTHLYPPVDMEQAIRFVDFKSYLPGAVLSKVDRMSMQVSLEVRTPFFSPSLMDLASRLPHEFLYRGTEMKPVLRDICRTLGLSHVADLPKKGFGMPAGYLAQNRDQLLLRARDALNYLNKSVAINDNSFGTKLSKFAGSNMNSLWATIVLGEWLQNFEVASDGMD
jgi:asparagine synthase (glutamine-hydrolysing)